MKPEGKDVARRSAYKVERAEHHEVVLMVRANHYSKSCSKTGLAWKISDTFGNIVGAAMFLPPLPPAAKYIENIAVQSGRVCVWQRVLSLHRLVVVPEQPQNVASLLVCAALRDLRRQKKCDAVVTFADSSAGHTGQVYRAMNAEYLGATEPASYWTDETGRRVSAKATVNRTAAQMRALGLTRKRSEGKHRFVWWLNSKIIRSPDDTAS